MQTFLTLGRIAAANASQSVDYDTGVICQLMGNKEQARKHFELLRLKAEGAVRAHPNDPTSRIWLAIVQARLGKAGNVSVPDSRESTLDAQAHFMLANLNGVLGNSDKALEQLELAVEKRYRNYIYMRIHPDFEGLASDPRFQALLERVLK